MNQKIKPFNYSGEIISNSPINILNADVVAKSYSNYFNDLEKVSN